MRRHQYRGAKEFLTRLLGESSKGRFRIRSLRAVSAAKDHDFELARRDLEYVKGISGREKSAQRLEVIMLSESGKLAEAQRLLDSVKGKGVEDQVLQARIHELKAGLAETGMTERAALMQRAAEIRAQNRFILEFGEYDD
jgi:hypothetical protein